MTLQDTIRNARREFKRLYDLHIGAGSYCPQELYPKEVADAWERLRDAELKAFHAECDDRMRKVQSTMPSVMRGTSK